MRNEWNMEKEMPSDLQRLGDMYRKGIYTLSELTGLAIDAAETVDPSSFADTLPSECLTEIRGIVSRPAEGFILVRSVCEDRSVAIDWEKVRREEKARFIRGHQRWADFLRTYGAGKLTVADA
jgi:hypothetical protein